LVWSGITQEVESDRHEPAKTHILTDQPGHILYRKVFDGAPSQFVNTPYQVRTVGRWIRPSITLQIFDRNFPVGQI